MTKAEPLWTCPKCGHRFVSRNLWHSCGRYRLADHFTGKDPLVRRLFDRFTALVRALGPVTIYAQKTRIVCQVRVRFAGAVARRRFLNVSLWLTQRAHHPTLRRAELIAPRCYAHTFRFTALEEFDEDFAALLRESYAIGCQEHLARSLPVGGAHPSRPAAARRSR